MKPELFQCGARDRDQALRRASPRPGASCVELRAAVIAIAEARGPRDRRRRRRTRSRRWEEQQIVDRARYHELVDELGIIALQRAASSAPTSTSRSRAPTGRSTSPTASAATCRCFLALSVNSPFWRGRAHRDDVLAGAGLPRVPARGHPAALRHLGDLLAPGRADDARRRDRGLHVPVVGRAPAPEAWARSRRGSSTSRRGSSTPSRWRRSSSPSPTASARLYDDDEPLVEYPTELIDDNKIRAALHGIDGEADRLPRRQAGRRRRRWPASWSSCSPRDADGARLRAELDGVEDLLANGTGAHRQLAIADANGDDLRRAARARSPSTRRP